MLEGDAEYRSECKGIGERKQKTQKPKINHEKSTAKTTQKRRNNVASHSSDSASPALPIDQQRLERQPPPAESVGKSLKAWQTMSNDRSGMMQRAEEGRRVERRRGTKNKKVKKKTKAQYRSFRCSSVSCAAATPAPAFALSTLLSAALKISKSNPGSW
jgi:hypothetical protein